MFGVYEQADEREAKLPAWARDTLSRLRNTLAARDSPLSRELDTLRPRVKLLTARNEALTELLECAARGGHTTAAEIVQVIEQYDFKDKE